ncbi:unnamed protein product [Pocillopora meandrina]|uniref:CHAT domain-containing protein n=1 Tax=Pocillopora meandrina TaxID=46732 RepID=A0AAU9X583_9CNID|nr:unnamed protein product [Pocillopora meandrina]
MIAFMTIALLVSVFLLNSDRIQKAIEICSECLILLNSTDQNSKDQFDSVLPQCYSDIFTVLFSKMLSVLYRESGIMLQTLGENLKAKEHVERALSIATEIGDRSEEASCYGNLGTVFQSLGQYDKAQEYLQKALVIRTEIGDREGESTVFGNLGNLFRLLKQYDEAEEYLQRALVIKTEIGDKRGEASCYGNLGIVFRSLGQYDKAQEYLQKALVIRTEIGDRQGEATDYRNLGTVFLSLGQYDKAQEYLQKALVITTKLGDRKGKAYCYGNLGYMFLSLGQYAKAKEYLQKALVIRTEIGDKEGEAIDNGNLGTMFHSLGQYHKAQEYLQKALVIRTEIGDRKGQETVYGNLGTIFQSLGQYDKAKECVQKALVITTEIGDRKGEAANYEELGYMTQWLGQYDKAQEYLQRALVIKTEIGDRKGEASCYGNLGTVFLSLGQYDKAQVYLQKALVIRTEIGDREGEATDYENLGTIFELLGQYDKAKEYLQKALVINTEIGNRKGEATNYGSLGNMFESLGQYYKAQEYLQRALVIKTEIGDIQGEASCYGNLGTVFLWLGQYHKAKEYLQKALVIRTNIGDRQGEATDYGNLGTIFELLGQYDMAQECLQKALVIRTEIGDRQGEASNFGSLGNLFKVIGQYDKAKEYLQKALLLSISRDTGDRRKEFEILKKYAILYLLQNKNKDTMSCLRLCIEKYEELRYFLGANDHFKTSLLEHSGIFPYKLLCNLLFDTGNARDALYFEELCRARGLSDLMVERYSVETHISANPQSWFGVENIFRNKNNCTCLYISYFHNDLRLWILKTSGVLHHRRISVEENLVQAGLPKDLPLDKFVDDNFRSLGILPTKDCEDRSLNMVKLQLLSPEKKSSARLLLVEEDEKVISSLFLCYKMFIAPVYDLLEEPEVIIVPDRSFYKVPFAALSEKEGAEYLSETHRIRVIPSLTTLKIIQDSPEDYHSNTGALIIGDPKVNWLPPLPGARKEAEMVGRLVGVLPLVGEEATKQAVLERISSVSLIHFAAHGDAERGEIALSPIPSTSNRRNAILPHEDYMLTMADVSRVKVRAKLVVLSCCHSGRGDIRAEGVIGIARAFLGSGARSVLVALRAISDSATEQLMSRFYEHLVEGESASESLHQAMKWMRKRKSTSVSEWASFTLIGDDVRLGFDKQR